MKKRTKVVIDTCIFIDGWFSNKPDAIQILDMIDNRDLYLCFSQDTIGELIYLTKNFARYNIDRVQDRIAFLQEIMTLFYYACSVNTMETVCPKINDVYDEMFLKCAIKEDVDYIISNDYKSGIHNVDLPNLKILSSADFIKEFATAAVS